MIISLGKLSEAAVGLLRLWMKMALFQNLVEEVLAAIFRL